MKIIVDAMSGDNAPEQIVYGAVQAANDLEVDILLTGDEEKIKKCLRDIDAENNKRIEIAHTPDVITMCDEPTSILRENRTSSMGLAFDLLAKGEGDAMISAGNSGALLCGSSLIIKRIKGIKRAALAGVIPFGRKLLIDSGANSEFKAEYLSQYATMGSIYMNCAFGIESPRVALLNNGTEESKGTPEHREAHNLLKNNNKINFIGNIEGRDLYTDVCDVVVTDGFSGNIALKTLEGGGKYFGAEIKKMFKSGILSAIAYLLVKKKVSAFKNSLDYRIYGGAPFLGVKKTVVKAHGSSDKVAIYHTVAQAAKLVNGGLIDKITSQLDSEVSEDVK